MNAITHRDNYFKCIETQAMPYGTVETGWLIGMAHDERDKIEFHWTPPIDVTKIAYHDLPESEQYFRWEAPPRCWDPKMLREIAKSKYSTGTTEKQKEDPKYTNFNWWRVYENMTPEMQAYFDREWDRRLNGFCFYNKGAATYMTGAHYTYCMHWWLKIGQYPIFKDRNLMDFYAWKAIEDDPACDGLLTPKHRRSNHTSIACFLGWEYVSRTPGTHFAIQSHGETGAATDFRDKVVPGWKKLVPFFQPVTSSGDNPKEAIVMEKVSRIGSKKGIHHDGEDALDSKIWFAPNGNGISEPLDGDILHRYVRDEPGKEDKLDILAQWGVMSRCLGAGGKAYFPSTRESVKAPYTDNWKLMYQQSLMSTAMDLGSMRTESGLRALFIPCYVGHTIKGRVNMFTGKHGESIIHKPDPETKAWLLANRCQPGKDAEMWSAIYDMGGAYEYELRQRILNRQDPAEKRRMPFNIDEVFAIVNPSCDFDVEMINRNLTRLDEHHSKGKTLEQHLTVRGRLEWVGDVVKGNVRFVEDPKGPFLWNREYLPVNKPAEKPARESLAQRLKIWANNVERDPPRQGYRESHGSVRPKSDPGRHPYEDLSWIKIGMDPQKLAAIDQKAKRISKASSHGFYPFRELVDGAWTVETEEDPNFAEAWDTNAFIFEYLHHPKEPRVHHEDMLKAAIFCNAKILFESQIPEFRDYMRQMGCTAFLETDAPWAKPGSKVVYGLASSENVIRMYFARLTFWIKRFCHPNKCPFRETMKQWMMMDPGDMERYDAGVSSGYAQLAAQPHELRLAEKTTNLQDQPVRQTLADTVVRYR